MPGGRPNRRQSQIRGLLEAASCPLTVDELRRALPVGTHERSVRWNLSALLAGREVMKVPIEFGVNYYEVAGSPHAHLLCAVCHQVQCLDVAAPDMEEAARRLGFQVQGVIAGTGICLDCRSKGLEAVEVREPAWRRSQVALGG